MQKVYFIEDISELLPHELAQIAKELRERRAGRVDVSGVSDEWLVKSYLDGCAWLRKSIAESEANDARSSPETESQLRARVIAERVLKEETEKKQRA
jgi:hypothetical protein